MGTQYKYADLYWNPDTEEIAFQLKSDSGQRTFTLNKKRKCVNISVTKFLLQMEISFNYKQRYPVRAEEGWIYIGLEEKSI